MKITNEQIIQSARRQRQIVDSQINIEPWQPRHRRNRGIIAAIAVAASIISFIAGYGVCAKMSQHDALPLAQNIQVQHDTILQTTTIRDTVYLMRIVTKYAKPTTTRSVLAHNHEQPSSSDKQDPSTQLHPTESSNAQMACSMLCDDIPYALLATP